MDYAEVQIVSYLIWPSLPGISCGGAGGHAPYTQNIAHRVPLCGWETDVGEAVKLAVVWDSCGSA